MSLAVIRQGGRALVQKAARFTTLYSLWFISIVLSLLGVYLIFELIIDLSFVAELNFYQLRVVRNFSFVILGLVWLVFAIGSETYFRRHLKKDLSINPIWYLLGGEVALIAVAFAISQIVI